MIPGSWSQCAIVTLLAFIAVGGAICFRPKRRNRRVKAARPEVLVDYSVKRARALKQLGPRYLLHTPINRNRNNTKTVLS